MKEIKLPIKSEIRSRAKILTEEAFRETRNYLKVNTKDPINSDNLEVYADLSKKQKVDKSNELNLGELYAKTSELREILNKISKENFNQYLNSILKYEYDEQLMDNLKNLLFTKIVTERQYRELYFEICLEMFKIYNKKTYNSPGMNFKTIILKRCQEEFYSQNDTKIQYPFSLEEDEKKAYLAEIKFGNIKLIAEFYNKGVIQVKVVNDCIEHLMNNVNDLNLRLLCELLKKICLKYYNEEANKLDAVAQLLEKN